jgi:hypothetical protein
MLACLLSRLFSCFWRRNIQEKLARLSEAFAYLVANAARAVYVKLGALLNSQSFRDSDRHENNE